MHVRVPAVCGWENWQVECCRFVIRRREQSRRNVFETVGHPHHITHTPDCREREPCNRAADSYQVAWWRVETRYPLEICFFQWIGYYDTQSPLLMIFLTFHGPLRNMHFFDESATMAPKARPCPILWFFMAPFEEGKFGQRFHFLQLFKTF